MTLNKIKFIWTWVKWIVGGCRFMHGLNLVNGLGPQIVFEVASQLRTGLRAADC